MQHKFVILVGHRLKTLIPNNKTIVQLCIENTEAKSVLSICE